MKTMKTFFSILLISTLAGGSDLEGIVDAKRQSAFNKLKSIKVKGKYQNYRKFDMIPDGAMWGMLKEWMGSKNLREPKEKLKYTPLNADSIFSGSSDQLRATWLGHSSFIMEVDGLRLLLDPVLSNNTSPVPWIYSVKRFQENAPISGSALPRVDVVIISHDHYDHLDKATIKAIHKKVDRFIVPTGLGKYLVKWGVPRGKVTALDWSESVTIKGCNITALPAQHFSGRGFGRDKTLWASWCVAGPGHKFYFSGDSGYHKTFKHIGDVYGPFDLVILDSGQYGKYWPHVHMLPEQAVQAFLDLKGRVSRRSTEAQFTGYIAYL
jgi:L-ascorbate metabolism protein UlaG (beta-lactamase superfamily)